MGRERLVGTVVLVALVLAAVHGGASWSEASALTAPPATVADSTAPPTTMGVAQPIPPPPLSSSDKKLEILDKIAIGLGLAAVATYLLTRRWRARDDDEDGDGEDEAPPPYTA